MALDSFIVGTNNKIAGKDLGAEGFIGASLLTDEGGVPYNLQNHAPAAATQFIDTAGFSAVASNLVDPFFNLPAIMGTGVSANQAGGSLNILAGTTPNAEFLARSVNSYRGSMRIRSSHILSSRIANNNFALLLADLVGEGLAYTINSATSVTVNVPNHGFSLTQMNGQSLLLGGITGAAGVPGRYAIASIPDANNITFTVAGWPANGSGTLTLFGRNYLRTLFTGTTVTNVNWDVQRNGWAAGDTVAAINTTASPGTVLMSALTGREAWLGDKLRASSATPSLALRAFRDENIPDPNVPLYVFLWSFNGPTAPASSTTWTLGHVAVEDYPNQEFFISGVRPQGTNNPLPINVVTGSLAANGPVAHDGVVSGNPVRIAGRAMTANYAAVASGDVADFLATLVGAQVVRPFSIPELDWQASIALTTAASTPLQAAAGAGLKRYGTALTIQNKSATQATEVQVLRGTTVIWGPFSFPVNSAIEHVHLPTPLQTAANEALNVQALTAGANVQVSAVGYTAP